EVVSTQDTHRLSSPDFVLDREARTRFTRPIGSRSILADASYRDSPFPKRSLIGRDGSPILFATRSMAIPQPRSTPGLRTCCPASCTPTTRSAQTFNIRDTTTHRL